MKRRESCEMSMNRPRFLARERGQALTEFLVVAAALLPLFLLMPMIAKYQDIAHSTQMASRYVAFDAMTRNDAVSSGWKPEKQLADEVRTRFFGNPEAAIVTGQFPQDDDDHRNMFWSDPRGAPLIKSLEQDVQLSYGPGRGATHGAGFQGAHDGDAFPMKGAMSLAARGVYTGNVSVNLINLPAGLEVYEPFDKVDLSIRRSTSVAIDTWTGNSPGEVQDKLDNPALSPVTLMQPIVPITDFLVSGFEIPLMQIKGPQLGKLDFWQDVVPPDRLRDPK